MLRDHSPRHNMTLAAYYMSHYSHLIPANTEIWEYHDTAATETILGSLK